MGCSFKCVKRGEHAIKEIVRSFIFTKKKNNAVTTFELVIKTALENPLEGILAVLPIILCESASRTMEIV
jgi:hypothetical protein